MIAMNFMLTRSFLHIYAFTFFVREQTINIGVDIENESIYNFCTALCRNIDLK